MRRASLSKTFKINKELQELYDLDGWSLKWQQAVDDLKRDRFDVAVRLLDSGKIGKNQFLTLTEM